MNFVFSKAINLRFIKELDKKLYIIDGVCSALHLRVKYELV